MLTEDGMIRHAQILTFAAEGMPAKEIAKRCGCTKARVQQVLTSRDPEASVDERLRGANIGGGIRALIRSLPSVIGGWALDNVPPGDGTMLDFIRSVVIDQYHQEKP